MMDSKSVFKKNENETSDGNKIDVCFELCIFLNKEHSNQNYIYELY